MRNDFEESLRAGPLEVDDLDIDDIPLDVVGLDLRLDLGDAAGIVLEQDIGTGRCNVRVDHMLFLRRAVGAAEGDGR